MDFITISVQSREKGRDRELEYFIRPEFIYDDVKELVCKGGKFFAYWTGERWSTSENQLTRAIDKAVKDKKDEMVLTGIDETVIHISLMRHHSSKLKKEFIEYCKQTVQSDVIFNSKVLFSNHVPKLEDYSTNQLPYYPKEGETPGFDGLMGVLYHPEELDKILWTIGALMTNSMSRIQKFLYLYGAKGTGKGTILKIIKQLFDGYHKPISLNLLTSNSEFATGQVKEYPLLIDEDSDISKIHNDTNLLKLTAHETLTINNKYKLTYDMEFQGLLITASNQRYQVRNVDSGITRRALTVHPSNNTLPYDEYSRLMGLVDYELPQIAYKAIRRFEELGLSYFEDYVDVDMATATDHIFAFVREHANVLGDPVTLKRASELYKLYLEDIGYDLRGAKKKIKLELQRYYTEYHEDKMIDGERYKNVFSGFKHDVVFPDKIDSVTTDNKVVDLKRDIFELKDNLVGTFDLTCGSYPAQEATAEGHPKKKWDDVTTTLDDINTRELHWVRVPDNHIVLDFDLKDETGQKDLNRNLENAAKFPPTYTEISKSGKGVHLHYIYDGNPLLLESLYEDDIEIKVFTGKQALRRKVTWCNDKPIQHITTGLPTKSEEKNMYNDVSVIAWNEKKIRTAIERNLRKEYHPSTKSSVDFIAHILNQAKADGVQYDVTDMANDILAFASQSTNQAITCMRVVKGLPFTTIEKENTIFEEELNNGIVKDEDIWFYDVEVFPNLFVIIYKKHGEDKLYRLINPSVNEVEIFTKRPLIGFNNRRYDNHIVYAAMLGKSNLELFHISKSIIGGDKTAFYRGAYNLSYADIYEYNSKKQGLKKWEIELGIKHDELELPWDKPVPEEMWERVADYCENDVLATEKVFEETYYDYKARLIMSSLSGESVSSITQTHAAKFIFKGCDNPRNELVYTDLSTIFPGYKFEYGKSSYLDGDPSEGGYVYSKPGIYEEVFLFDVESMHPHSAIALNYFGKYTSRFKELVDARLAVKHRDFEKAGTLLDGALKPYLNEEDADDLAYALKIIINIVYGFTSAKFDNPFKHKDNIDNIVAKYGALFMMTLQNELEHMGVDVVHVKTDSIKVVNPTEEVKQFIFDFARKYKFNFQHEATYSKMALVNKSTYIAKYGWSEKEKDIDTWTAVGAQFAEPYVFKTLFSKQTINEEDFGITKAATLPIYLGKQFVGKVARVYASVSGSEMTRYNEELDKHYAVNGTKGYLWKLESEYSGHEDVDMTYYDELVEDAVKTISKYGDVAEFTEVPF